MPTSASCLIRYAIITLHVILWIVCLPLSAVFTGSILLLILHAIAGLGMLIYIPPTIYLSLRNSGSEFDQAGREVAYAVCQMCVWLGCGIYGIVSQLFFELACADGWSLDESKFVLHRAPAATCAISTTTTVIAFCQFGLTLGWFSWIAHLALHTPGMSAREAYKIPAHRLVRGDKGRGEGGWVEMGRKGETGLKLAED